MTIECAPLQNRDTERLKEVDTHSVGLNAGGIVPRRTAEGVESSSRMPIANDPDVAGGDRTHAGKRRKSFLQLLEERGHLLIAVPGAGKVEAEEQDVVRFKSQLDALEIEQRVDEKSCTHQQGGGNGNLANHQALIQPEPLPARRGASRFPQSRMIRDSCRLPGRRQPEKNSSGKRDSEREHKHPPVELYLCRIQLGCTR